MPYILAALYSLAALLPASISDAALPSRVASERIAAATNTMPLTYRGQAAYRVSDGRTKVYVTPDTGRELVFGWVGGPNLLAGEGAEASNTTGAGGRHTTGIASVLADRRLRLVFPVRVSTGTRTTREYYYNTAGELVISELLEKLSGPPVAISLRSDALIAPPLSTPQSRTDEGYAAIAAVYDGGVFVQRAMLPAERQIGDHRPRIVPDIQKSLVSNAPQTSLRITPEYTLKVGDTIAWIVRWSLHRLPASGAASPETRAEIETLLAPPSQ